MLYDKTNNFIRLDSGTDAEITHLNKLLFVELKATDLGTVVERYVILTFIWNKVFYM